MNKHFLLIILGGLLIFALGYVAGSREQAAAQQSIPTIREPLQVESLPLRERDF